MFNKKKRSLVASAGALVTAAALAFSGAAAAHAAPTIPSSGAAGSLNITKYTQPDVQQPESDGLPKSAPTGSVAIAGVQFTIKQVTGVDLSTNAGWKAAADMSVDAATAAAATGDSYTGVTDANGRVRFGQNNDGGAIGVTWNSVSNSVPSDGALPIGLYLVEETGYTQAPGGPESVTFGAPFLVTVPLTNPTDTANWMYNIYLYPKNSTGNEKTVTEGGIAPGSNVQWTIKGDIQQSTNISKYTVTDSLDARLTTPADGSGVSVSITNGVSPALDLTSSDYTVSVTANGDGTTGVVVDFTATGRAKLVVAWQGNGGSVPAANNRQVQVVINSTVNTLVAPNPVVLANGEITNQATIEPNSGVVAETNVSTTKWGSLSFSKVSSNAGNPALPGTEFRIVAKDPAVDAAGSGANPWITANTVNAAGDASVAASTFVADQDGLVVISGLRYSNWADGAAQNPFTGATCESQTTGGANCSPNPKFQQYWLVETKAAADHELLAQPVKFTITAPETALLPGGADLVNVPKNGGFVLPLTGGTGTLLLTVLGVGILAVVLIVARRRNTIATAE